MQEKIELLLSTAIKYHSHDGQIFRLYECEIYQRVANQEETVPAALQKC